MNGPKIDLAAILARRASSPRRLIGLSDMITFEANALVSLLHTLGEWREQCENAATGCATSQADDRTKKAVRKWVEAIQAICGVIGLSQSEDRCLWFSNHLLGLTGMTVITNQFVACEIDVLTATLGSELQKHKFAYIPAECADYFERVDLFGEEFHKVASPQINSEITAAGNCLACELNTAAVFHLMRVVEMALQKFIPHLNANGVLISISCPVEFSTWGKLITAIDEELRRVKLSPATVAREAELHFYSTMLHEIRAFQYAWRDPVMHARFEEPSEAENLFRHVKRFMQELATRVSLK